MAGDWIKMRSDLHEDEAVISICEATGLDEFAVVGRLHRLWSWADRQALGGNARVTLAYLDTSVRCAGFAQAMVDVGWLLQLEKGVQFPNFERHNGKSAKQRALNSSRVKRWRNGNVTKPKRSRNDGIGTREEKSVTTPQHPTDVEGASRRAAPAAEARQEESPAPKQQQRQGSLLPQSLEATPGLKPLDQIFGGGLALLIRKGVEEKHARSFLGKLRARIRDDIAVLALLHRAEQDDVSDPVAWLSAGANHQLGGRPGKRAAAHAALGEALARIDGNSDVVPEGSGARHLLAPASRPGGRASR